MRTFLIGLVLALTTSAAYCDEAIYNGLTNKATVEKSFYSANLNWHWRPTGVTPILGQGYAHSNAGGTVRSVTVCLYSESSFTRNFQATASVVAGGNAVQQITFTTTFPPLQVSCHRLNDFHAVVPAGDFQITAAFSALDADNVFAGLSATDAGDIFDIQIGASRPPFASGAQGPVRMNGLGLGYSIDESSTPITCVAAPTSVCLANGRFRVEASYQAGSTSQGQAQAVAMTSDTGYLWFFAPTNVEAVVKVLDACGLNNKFWVFAGGLTDVNVVLKVTDTRTGVSKTYTNPQGIKFAPIQDTAAFPCS